MEKIPDKSDVEFNLFANETRAKWSELDEDAKTAIGQKYPPTKRFLEGRYSSGFSHFHLF
jgi:hypothetical protein